MRIIPRDDAPETRRIAIMAALVEELTALGHTIDASRVDGITTDIEVRRQSRYHFIRLPDGSSAAPRNTAFKISWGGPSAYAQKETDRHIQTILEPKRGFNITGAALRISEWVKRQKSIKAELKAKADLRARLQEEVDRLTTLIPPALQGQIDIRVTWRSASLSLDLNSISVQKMEVILKRIIHIMELEEIDYGSGD